MWLSLSSFVILIFSMSPAFAENELDINENPLPPLGWQIPGTGINLGGYTSASFEHDKHQSDQLGLDDLSLFVHWENDGKFRLFSEIDLENSLSYDEGAGFTTKHAYLALERLYLDYLYSDRLNLRYGKFLTPIGHWNLIHAQPLQWTNTRPLITERTFPTNATGAMAYGTLPVIGQNIDYSIYASFGEEWRPDPDQDAFEEAYGIRLSLPDSGVGEFGFSYANFEQKDSIGEKKNLFGLDYIWSRNRYEISAELAYRFSDKTSRSDERGFFIQGVVPISEHWYGVARYELYDQAGERPAVNIALLGVAMRLSPALIFKAEFSRASNNNSLKAPEGFFTSFSILF